MTMKTLEQRRCFCPDDCNCHYPWRPNYCGCKGHQPEGGVMTETSAETYNGWKNYPTWAVNLWLTNDEGLYNEGMELTRQALDRAVQGVSTTEAAGRYNVAEAFKSWVRDDLVPDLGASFAADLLGYALDCIDWFEIADDWIETVTD